MHYLGIDAGASATKWALINDSGILMSGKELAMDGHLYRESSKSRMEEVLHQVAKKINGTKVSGVYMGITGVTHDGYIENLLQKNFNAPSKVVSDIELAYRANFSDRPGILLYAGTGSVAFSIDEKNEIHKIGGWGYLLGDEGAGYWIGREAIRHALFLLEENIVFKSESLAGLTLNAMNASDWESIKNFVYSNERSTIAALSRVVDLAAVNGDLNALNILEKAAGHLAELVSRIDKVLVRKSLSVKFAGGISSSTQLYLLLEKYLRQRVSISTVDIAVRAAELAR